MTTNRPSHFGMLIRHARRGAGLTQEELAERAGISSRTISDLERGVARTPRIDTLELLADALDLSSEERAEWVQEQERLGKRQNPPSRSANESTGDRRKPLPAPLTRLVGRQQEIQDILGLLDRPETRLLTLTGPGGVGKTRLALAVAYAVRENYPAGVSFVSLISLGDPGMLLPTIAATLGLHEASAQPLLDALAAYLRKQRLLLVLDNFEQIIEAAASVTNLLSVCSDLTILVTSRAALRVQSEQLYRVPTLSVPEREQLDPATSDAVELFVERAVAVKPAFRVTADNAAAICEICRRLDGLPLALELAAARLDVLSPRLLLERIEQQLPLLTVGPRDAPVHQRTLRNTIAWSYDLLSLEQQELIQRLSVFRNGWVLEAAVAVAGVGPERQSDLVILEGLSALVEHSLITQRENQDGDVRFAMLATIREFAQEKLVDSGADADARSRHARYYGQLVEAVSTQFNGPNEIACFDLLEREHDNLHAAIRWLREEDDIEAALGLAGALGTFWGARGHYTVGRAHLETLLQLSDRDARTAARAKALWAVTLLKLWQGDWSAEVVDLSREALSIWTELEIQDRLPDAYVTLGIASVFQGDLEQAEAATRCAVEHARRVGDLAGLSRALTNLGAMAQTRATEEALDLFQESITVARLGGSPNTLALTLGNMGGLLLDQGDYARAERLFCEALDLWHTTGNQWGIAEMLESQAKAALPQGQSVRAARLTAAATVLRERISVPVQPVDQDKYAHFIEELRATLGDQFDSVWAVGMALPIGEAIVEALENITSQ